MPRHQVNQTEIYCEDTGRGLPILLAHSFLCSGSMWAPQVETLSRDFRVVNMDLRGHGRSASIAAPIRIDDLVTDAIQLLDRLGIERAVWAGLSIGGMIALNAALSHSERVEALILLDSDAGAEEWLGRTKYQVMSAATRLVGLTPFLPTVEKLMFGNTTRAAQPALVAEWRQRFAAADIGSMRRVMHALNHRPDLSPEISGIAVPCLVMVGAEDVALPPAKSRRIAGAIPGAVLREIPGAGHLATLEQPDLVTAAMTEFLTANFRD